ncbi:MAG: hypothetical protein VX346_06690 [Planctomycetota bacterium]|nr:hypothetical protein [Planctomycetota bacterium]
MGLLGELRAAWKTLRGIGDPGEQRDEKIKRNDNGEVVNITLTNTNISDATLMRLKGLTKLQALGLRRTRVTNQGLVHLQNLTNLRSLVLGGRITDAGVAELQKALPNCDIERE